MRAFITILHVLAISASAFASAKLNDVLLGIKVKDEGATLAFEMPAQLTDVTIEATLNNFRVEFKPAEKIYELRLELIELPLAQTRFVPINSLIDHVIVMGIITFTDPLKMTNFVNTQLIPMLGKNIQVLGGIMPVTIVLRDLKRQANSSGIFLQELRIPLQIRRYQLGISALN